MSLQTDSELVQAYRAGESAAFEVLVARHVNAIFGYVARLTGDKEAAADTTQEAFVKAWKGLDSFDALQNFRTWLFTIARNSAYDWLRRKKHVSFSAIEGEDEDYAASIPDEELLPDALRERADDARYLETLLADISPGARDILLLHYVDGLTFDEIGKIYGESLNTVKSRHRRALLALRTKAEGWHV